MIDSSANPGCSTLRPLLATFNDGELNAESILQVETHLRECELCAEELRLLRAIQFSLRQAVTGDAVVSDEFLNRLRTSLEAERGWQRDKRVHQEQTESLSRWRERSWPMLALAAAILVWWLAPASHPLASPTLDTAPQSSAARQDADVLTVKQLLDKLVYYHSHPPQPEVTEAAQVPLFEQDVGVRVQLPRLTQYGANWSGGSVVPVNNQRAAFLRYDLPGIDAPTGRRITLYVYDSELVPVHASLEPRVVRNLPIYVGNRRGYSIAARQHAGIGYAIATDLDDRESAEIIASLNTLH